MNETLYPLTFAPVYKDYIWGGSRIPEIYGRDVQMPVCAESWEIADRPEGMSVVANGALAGASLQDLVRDYGTALIGTCAGITRGAPSFPLLIKIIDAKQRLSLQVHPNDGNASLTGGEPKTEMWYLLDADPGATIFAGLDPSVTQEQFADGIRNAQLEPLLNTIPARKDQAIYVPGGRVHAIGAGCLLLEIQQNSNTTYRVYDWGRVGNDGKPRDLHVEQALQVIDWSDQPPSPSLPQPLDASPAHAEFLIQESPYFRVTRHDLSESVALSNDGRSFHVLFLVSGALSLSAGGTTIALTTGTSCLLPASIPEYQLTPDPSSASFIKITL